MDRSPNLFQSGSFEELTFMQCFPTHFIKEIHSFTGKFPTTFVADTFTHIILAGNLGICIAIQQGDTGTCTYFVYPFDSLGSIALFIQTFRQRQYDVCITNDRNIDRRIGTVRNLGRTFRYEFTEQIVETVIRIRLYIERFCCIVTSVRPTQRIGIIDIRIGTQILRIRSNYRSRQTRIAIFINRLDTSFVSFG